MGSAADLDYAYALSLQREIYNEASNSRNGSMSPSSSGSGSIPRTRKSLVDPDWELIDPNPDALTLFQEFDKTFFWGNLNMVEVKWSKKMTLCAGLCRYEGFGGLCCIVLSEPLLKLRPRKDLVETLLHEMIHAYLFVTQNNKDHDAHGPEFCKHMQRINQTAGCNITIYHSFHGEVAEYRKHWWRCQGPCQNRPPYFGYVKRAMNRAPSSKDFWWNEHERMCGGKYVKIKEPENYKKKPEKKSKTLNKNTTDISQILTQHKSGKANTKPTNGSSSRGSLKANGNMLGGNKITNNAGRGIPSTSRLISTQPLKVPSSQSDSNKSEIDSKEGVWNNVTQSKQTKLSKIRKRDHHSDIPMKNKKKKPNLYHFFEKMRKTGRKSVNKGAPAFKSIKPVVSFSKKVLHFNDSDDENSDKENNLHSQTTSAYSSQSDSRQKEESGRLVKTENTVQKNGNIDTGVTLDLLDCIDDDVLFDEFKHTIMNSQNVASSSMKDKASVKVKKEFTDTHGLSSDDDLDGGLLRNKSKKPKNRLPSLSDDDETLTQVWKNHADSKKLKFESALDDDSNEPALSYFSTSAGPFPDSKEKLFDPKCNKRLPESCPSTSTLNETSHESVSQFQSDHCKNDADSCLFDNDASMNIDTASTHNNESANCCSSEKNNPESSVVACPICGVMCSSENIIQHVDDCLTSGESHSTSQKTDATKPSPSVLTVTNTASPGNCDSNAASSNAPPAPSSGGKIELNCTPGPSCSSTNRTESSRVSCPICGTLMPPDDINNHVDECLSLQAINESDWD